jgi:hypothetical protein
MPRSGLGGSTPCARARSRTNLRDAVHAATDLWGRPARWLNSPVRFRSAPGVARTARKRDSRLVQRIESGTGRKT